MKVKIKIPHGRMTFDMPADKAMDLLRRATEYAEFKEPKEPKATANVVEPVKTTPPKVETVLLRNEAPINALNQKSEPAPKPKEPMKSRVETMFGNRETWNKPAEEKKPEPPKHENVQAYSGFLYIKCDGCGKEKGFCTKSPIVQNRCECGHITDLRDLLPMFVKCECGAEFKYMTNMIANAFTYNCLRCGSPIDMEINGKGTAFVTMGSQERRSHDQR